MLGKHFSAAEIALASLVLISPTFAAMGASPETTVRNLYTEYLPGPGSTMPQESAENRIRPYASRSLGKAIDMENRCMEKSHEICAIDVDYIIGGQDWDKLTAFRIEAAKSSPAGLAVRACFKVMPQYPVGCVLYSFVHEGGAWKIDNVAPPGLPPLKDAILSYFRDYDENNNARRKH